MGPTKSLTLSPGDLRIAMPWFMECRVAEKVRVMGMRPWSFSRFRAP